MNDNSRDDAGDTVAGKTDDTTRRGIVHKIEDLLLRSSMWIAIGIATVAVLIVES